MSNPVKPLLSGSLMLFGSYHSGVPCPSCMEQAPGNIWLMMVLPLPAGVMAPLSRRTGKPICWDCASAEGLVGQNIVPSFNMARISVGNDRLEQLRLPGAPMGLVYHGLVRPSLPGDFEALCAWQEEMGFWDEGDEG